MATKLGREGCTVMTNEEEFRMTSFKVRAIDTTGAGDAYDASFVVARLKGWDLRYPARFANAVATLKTMKAGARSGLPRMAEVERFMKHEHR